MAVREPALPSEPPAPAAPPIAELLARAFAPLASEPLDPARLAELAALFRWRACRRGETILAAGDRTRTFELVVEGVLRLYYLRADGREFTKDFVRPGTVHATLDCLLFDAPARYSVTAVLPSRLLVADYARAMAVFDRDLTLQKVARRMFERLAAMKLRREASLLMDTAAQRYAAFRAELGELEAVLSAQMIATYLGVTPETLSRVKRDLAERS